MTQIEIGTTDLLMVTFDSLRFDVASRALEEGRIPFLSGLIGGEWERRHTPGNFTFAAHAAFFAGFWPTPITPGNHIRPFALRFTGQRTVDSSTCILQGENIVAGLQSRGYRTVCIGGVGFFNKQNPLGSVFPAMFEESEWAPEFSVSALHSTREQVRRAIAKIDETPELQPLFLFLNISATHPPTHFYTPGSKEDSVETQIAALAYVDRQLPALFDRLAQRRHGGRAYLMSDHGTLFGEEGFTGHRIGHPDVWNVPYAEYAWEGAS